MDMQERSLKRRALGGSLPFKKRCFRVIEQHLNGASIPTVFSEKASFRTKNPQDLPIFTNSYVPGYSETYPQKIRAAGSAFSAHPQHGINTRSASLSDDEEDGSTGPRPGRCHGRTGSAQAYCQRLPCYKGSNYCKRHYDQYVSKSGSSTTICRNTPETEEKGSSSSRSHAAQQQQDKRFSGAKGEIRCKATTTRGRECAYVCVNGTKYCFMHADYDTNPPPRRGGKHAATTVITEAAAASSSKSKKKEAHRSSSIVSDSSSSKSTDRKRRNTAEKLAQKHADSPFPLLSMISSDQWANKLVRVSVGPFEGHIGNVEKWSNGWVGVRIPDVGLHNRRSFELYLDDESMEDLSSEQKKGLMRCVSRDAVTPSPLYQDNNKRTPSPKESSTAMAYQPVTPNLTMEEAESRVISKARSLDGIEMVQLPEVTPVDARGRACVDSPMIESLLASQEHNSKLDLLFGTAALDRSRRSIRRPKIYQDTEMLDKKRSRKVPLTMEG